MRRELAVSFGKILWVGLACCLIALFAGLFPRLSFDLGISANGAWMLFSFGLFLIVASTAVALNNKGPDR